MGHLGAENRFQNTSGPNLENNYGNKSKFTPDQLKERLHVHAMAVANSHPTYKQIIARWKERFGVEITEQSEKEWRKSNRNKIEKKKQELIESGEIAVPIVSDKVLADSLNVHMINNARINKQIQDKVTAILIKLDVEKLNGEEPKESNALLKAFEVLMGAYRDSSKAFVTSLDKMSNLAGKAKMVDAKASAEDEDKMRLLQSQTEEDEDGEVFDPADVVISDEDRQSLK